MGLLNSSKKENVNGIFLPDFNSESQEIFPIKLFSKRKLSVFKFIFLPGKISILDIFLSNSELNLLFINRSSSCGISILTIFLLGLEISNLKKSSSICISLIEMSKSYSGLKDEKSFSNEIICSILELGSYSFQAYEISYEILFNFSL